MPSELSEELVNLEIMLGQAVGAPTQTLDPEAQNFGPTETFELFISPFPLTARGPFPQSGLFALFEERKKALDTRQVREDYNSKHPYPQRSQFPVKNGYDNFMVQKWWRLESAALAPKIRARESHAKSIDNLLLAKKQGIFGGIAAESRTLLLRLRVLGLLDAGIANYSWPMGVMATKPETQTAETDTALAAYVRTLQDFFRQYASANAAGLEKIAVNLEAVQTSFLQGAVIPLSGRLGVRIPHGGQLNSFFGADFTDSESPDAYQFRNNGDRIPGFLGFLQNFDRSAKGPALTFTCGPPGIRYVLQHSSGLQFTALQYGSNSEANVYNFSPVRFRMEVPKRYAPVALQTFDRLAKEFGDRIVPSSELRVS